MCRGGVSTKNPIQRGGGLLKIFFGGQLLEGGLVDFWLPPKRGGGFLEGRGGGGLRPSKKLCTEGFVFEGFIGFSWQKCSMYQVILKFSTKCL